MRATTWPKPPWPWPWLGLLGALLGAVVVPLASADATDLLLFSDGERARVAAHGPWPMAVPRDPSNRTSGQPAAIELGEVLFHNASLSTVGGLRCASCHEAWRGFVDGRAQGLGAQPGSRNTLSLFNVGLNRWFGWDGANDSLWAQSVRPMLDPREMGASAAHVAALIHSDPTLRALYGKAFGGAPDADAERVLVNVGKALAAFQETLVSARTPFDEFRDALLRGDAAAASRYPLAAQRGLRLFEGRGRCVACHAGPTFSDGEFHRSLIVSSFAEDQADSGRQAGVQRLLANPHNLLGRYNDDGAGEGTRAAATARAASETGLAGAFRTPGLREVAATAPYMHDGSVGNLCTALRPHAVLEPEGGAFAPRLSIDERRDLVAFLETLSAREDSPLVDFTIYRCR